MQDFLVTLFFCSAAMSVLALIYMALTPLLAKRYSVTGRYYAWLVLVIGLMVPYRPHFKHAIINVNMPVISPAAVRPIVQMGNGIPAATFTPVSAQTVLPWISWWQAAAAVWLGGMVLFLIYHGIKHYRFLKLATHWSQNITDEQTLTIFQSLKSQMQVTGQISLQVCDSITSPMMIGFVHSRILLPNTDYAPDELSFILKHELVHCKRRDLWYKGLVLVTTAVHWFNPIVYLMAKAIDIQCEQSCDRQVILDTDTGTRLSYTETIIGVARYQSKRRTPLSTYFYGGKKGMKKRIFSIMDTHRKKTGIAVICGALILTVGTGAAFAAKAEAQPSWPPAANGEAAPAPWISVAFVPNSHTYQPYAAFGISISEDGSKLLYQGRPVRQFVDEQADGWAFYLDETGGVNLSAVRNAAGEITGIETITAQKAREYYKAFFKEELAPDYLAKAEKEAVQDVVKELGQEALHKYDKYQPFGVTCSETDGTLTYNGQRVKFFIDQPSAGIIDVLWTDAAGVINLAAVYDTSGQVTGVERISDEKVQEYQSAVDTHMEGIESEIEKKVEEKINKLYP